MRQSSIASTCYAAGGVSLAFTQEDFLVGICICDKLFPQSVLVMRQIDNLVHNSCVFQFSLLGLSISSNTINSVYRVEEKKTRNNTGGRVGVTDRYFTTKLMNPGSDTKSP